MQQSSNIRIYRKGRILPKKKISEKAKKLAGDILDSTEVTFSRALLFKRNSFDHKKEVRLIYFGDDADKKNKPNMR